MQQGVPQSSLMSDFRILELTVSGFKGFFEPRTFQFDYGINFVLGDNGLGKTSIAEAIAFAAFLHCIHCPYIAGDSIGIS